MSQYDVNQAPIQYPPLAVHLPPSTVTTGDILLGSKVPFQITIQASSIRFVSSKAVTASDTAYWSLALAYYAADGTAVAIKTITTKTTGSGGTGSLPAGVPVVVANDLTTLPDGAILKVTATSTGSPADLAAAFYVPCQ